MKRFKRIVVTASPGHLGAPVLRAAAKVAAANGAQLTVLDVVDRVPARRRVVTVDGRPIDLQELLLEDSRQRLRGEIAGAGIQGASVEARAGRPYIEVTRHVMETGCDLVIVGESPRSKDRPRVVAPDVMQLLRACPEPVWVMCPSRAKTLRLLALVDPDPTDPVRNSLGDRVLELAMSITRTEGGELHVAHAWELAGESALRHSAFVALPAREVDMIVRASAAEHRARLDELAERHGVAEVGGMVHLLKGPPSRVLPVLADQLNSNLIVMGTVARTGLSSLIMGNTAETMLRRVRCSVLTVKPEGFLSPIEPGQRG